MNIGLIIVFLGTLAFIYFWQKDRDKAEELRFREFVIANKSKDVEEYATALPSLKEDEIKPQDELIDINDVDPKELLEIIKQQHESH